MAFWIANMEIARSPAASIDSAGRLLFVEDDGARSTVHLTSVDAGDDTVVTELPDVVWTAKLLAGRGEAFLVHLERGTGKDRGVWAVSLADGSVRQAMPAPREPGLGVVRPVALIPFRTSLLGSPDGSLLLRESCNSLDGTFDCVTDVLDLDAGRSRSLPVAEGFIGIAGHWAVAYESCGEVSCRIDVIDLETGDVSELPGTPDGIALGSVRGEVVVSAAASFRGNHSYAIDVTRLADGRRERILRNPHDQPLSMGCCFGWSLELPSGWVLISIEKPAGFGTFALSLSDGALEQIVEPDIRIPLAPFRPPGLFPDVPSIEG